MAGKAGGGGASPGQPGVYLKGLADLRRTLGRIDRELGKNLARSLREIGKDVKRSVQQQARRFRDSGNLERSIRYSVRAKAASVYSNEPYAPVTNWGGTIQPRGVPIRFPRREWMQHGVRNSRREIDRELEGLLDAIADQWEQ